MTLHFFTSPVHAVPDGEGNEIFQSNVGIGTTTPVGGLTVMNGNVGIGTWSPTHALQVIGSSRFNGSLVTTGGITAGNSFIASQGSSLNGGVYMGSIVTVVGRSTFHSPIGVGTTNPVAGMAVMLGNVGIGTWSPTGLLQIVGGDVKVGLGTFDNPSANYDLYVTGNIQSDGSIFLADGTELNDSGDLGTASGWTDDGEVLRLDTQSDRVGIGTVDNAAGTKLAVIAGNVGIGTWSAAADLEIVEQGNTPLMVSDGPLGRGNLLIVQSSGNVGIGTSDLTDAKFRVEFLSAESSAGTEYGQRIVVDDTNGVAAGTDITYGQHIAVTHTGGGADIFTYGIRASVTGATSGATNAYGAYFTASGADENYGLYAAATEGVAAAIFLNDYGTTTDVRDVVVLQRRNNGGTAGTGMGGRLAFSLENSNGNLRSAAAIDGVWEDATNASEEGALVLSTGVAGSLSERLRIQSAGNVGIGTSTPVGALTVMSGNVGIGTWSPNKSLEVIGAVVARELEITTAASVTVDWNAGNQQFITLDQAGHTVNMSNFDAGQVLRLVVCQDGTGSRTVTNWDADIIWSGGSAPTLTTTANKCDIMAFVATEATGAVKLFGSTVLNF